MKAFLRNNRGLVALLLCMGLVRTALADWNPIPSASMRPTLLEGDVVEMRDEQLILNGHAVAYGAHTEAREPFQGGEVRAWRSIEQLPELPARRNFGPFTVPAGQYFFLGDNRDNSADSRYIGFVPRELLIGHAHHVLASVDMKGNWMPRFARFGQVL